MDRVETGFAVMALTSFMVLMAALVALAVLWHPQRPGEIQESLFKATQAGDDEFLRQLGKLAWKEDDAEEAATEAALLFRRQLNVTLDAVTEIARAPAVPLHLDRAVDLDDGAKLVGVCSGYALAN
jgi:hypothetical protein